MRANQIKEFLPLFTAIAEGKQMQCRTQNDMWMDIPLDAYWEFDQGDDPSMWRVKPESQLVPFSFEDAEFLIGKAVRNKESKYIATITSVREFDCKIFIDTDFNYLLEFFTFLDGTPCGKLVETSNK